MRSKSMAGAAAVGAGANVLSAQALKKQPMIVTGRLDKVIYNTCYSYDVNGLFSL